MAGSEVGPKSGEGASWVASDQNLELTTPPADQTVVGEVTDREALEALKTDGVIKATRPMIEEKKGEIARDRLADQSQAPTEHPDESAQAA